MLKQKIFQSYDPIEQFALTNYDTFVTLPVFHVTGANFYFWGLSFLLIIFLEIGLCSHFLIARFFLLKIFLFVREIVSSTITLLNQRFYIFLICLFLILLVSNLTGLLPYSYTVTSSLVSAFTLSFLAVGGIVIIGCERYGVHFLDRFLPAGVPYLIVPLLMVIEIISYLMRFFSLAIRLFANMVSGHILIKILISASWYLLSSISGLSFLALLLSTLCIIIFILELFIAFLQAYVFTFLTSVYLSEIISIK